MMRRRFDTLRAGRGAATRHTLLRTATDLIRRQGFVFTTVDQICEHAGVTKGAFFHHFRSKDDLADACLAQWDGGAAAMESGAPFQTVADPRARALGYMDFYIQIFDDPKMLKSCLAGTTVQEVADTNARLRDSANVCFVNAEKRFQSLLDAAAKGRTRVDPASAKATAGPPKLHAKADTASLAALWMAAVQGSLILYKASQDATVIRKSLEHVKAYIAGQLGPARRKGR